MKDSACRPVKERLPCKGDRLSQLPREYPKRYGRDYRYHPWIDASPDMRDPVRFRSDNLQDKRKTKRHIRGFSRGFDPLRVLRFFMTTSSGHEKLNFARPLNVAVAKSLLLFAQAKSRPPVKRRKAALLALWLATGQPTGRGKVEIRQIYVNGARGRHLAACGG